MSKYGRAWKRIRDKYIKSHPYCEECWKTGKETPAEEVHHIIPMCEGGRHDRSNLMAVCSACHIRIHERMKQEEKHERRHQSNH